MLGFPPRCKLRHRRALPRFFIPVSLVLTRPAAALGGVHQDSTTPPIIERLMESSFQESGESMRTKATTNL
jgi:hypothetical protein